MHIKSSISKDTYKAIYRLLDRVSPIDGDCGLLCDAVCCNCGDDSASDGERVSADETVPREVGVDSEKADFAARKVSVDSEKVDSVPCEVAVDKSEDEEVGIYLLPGEELLLEENADMFEWNWDNVDNYDFPESWKGEIAFVDCKGLPCNRRFRPMQCRTYPVLPHYLNNGDLVLIFNDVELPYICPLVENPRKFPLNYSFLKATHTAWKHLARDPLIHDYIEYDSAFRYDDEISIVFRG